MFNRKHYKKVKREVTKQKQIFVMYVTDKKYWKDSLYIALYEVIL